MPFYNPTNIFIKANTVNPCHNKIINERNLSCIRCAKEHVEDILLQYIQNGKHWFILTVLTTLSV